MLTALVLQLVQCVVLLPNNLCKHSDRDKEDGLNDSSKKVIFFFNDYLNGKLSLFIYPLLVIGIRPRKVWGSPIIKPRKKVDMDLWITSVMPSDNRHRKHIMLVVSIHGVCISTYRQVDTICCILLKIIQYCKVK